PLCATPVPYTTLFRSSFEITINESAAALDEVVVVGYGTQTREEVTGAMSSVKSEDIVTQGSGSVEKSLQGRVPGVQVESSGGNRSEEHTSELQSRENL